MVLIYSLPSLSWYFDEELILIHKEEKKYSALTGFSQHKEMEIPGFSTKNQENVISGFIDTGSPSFSDVGMPEVPSRWKGQCQVGESFTQSSCNKKVIGARYYLSGYEAEERSHGDYMNADKAADFKSPRDSSGHGSHTASIAAGRYVSDMNYNGLGAGGARGGAPMSRISVYKTCWDSGCYDADLLAAFDDAIICVFRPQLS
ncbi:unnamed protein product [Musa acuminata subsp. malaccensis]|uniref:(wild Malaysian banana) hypothetical protein n=1 Tax=Musa acuminata subsp. malaccensis TaxID=214687 RepID=A0A804KL63_MUSAM|nr:unnamed protein product [Musa acuminata subsp. malaccensis]